MFDYFTDPHIGLNAKSHTTAASSKKLDAAIQATLCQIVEASGNPLVCGGDLFHRAHNKEAIIETGIGIVRDLAICVGGNHDFTSRADDKSSMDLVAALCPEVVMAPMGETCVSIKTLRDGTVVGVIPHHSDQQLFDKAIDEFISDGTSVSVLFLHCNYNNFFAQDTDTALNLTEEQAIKLLDLVDHIIIGHEHNRRTELGGRVVIPGNIHPTSFHDVGNKYYITYDASKPLEDRITWHELSNVEDTLMVLKAQDIYDLPEAEFDVDPHAQPPLFVDVSGSLDSEHMPELVHRINKVWEKWDPLMVRNGVNVLFEETASVMESGQVIEDFTAKIKEGLADNEELLAIFVEELAELP